MRETDSGRVANDPRMIPGEIAAKMLSGEVYDHATAVHRGDQLRTLRWLLGAIVATHGPLRVPKDAIEARVEFSVDLATNEYVLTSGAKP